MYIAIDVGGTKTTVASFKSLDPEDKIAELTFHTNQDFEKGLFSIEKAIKELNKSTNIEGIGICLPGEIKDNDLFGATNLRDWENKRIVDRLKTAFDTKIKIDQDSACAALAEGIFGNMEDFNSFFHLIIGTGLGSAFAKKIGSKWEVKPTEICLMIVDADGKKHSSLGVRGLLESYTAGKDLESNLGEPLENISDDHKIWDEVAKYLAIGITNVTILLNPEVVTFSGGLMDKRPFLVQKIEKELKKLSDLKIYLPKLELSTVKGNTALLGALAILK